MDLQALQVPGYAFRGIGRYARALTQALAERGALAAVLLAPELPPPAGLPDELVEQGLVHWDGADAVRQLVAREPDLVHLVAAPFLHVAPGDPTGLITSVHWARVGVPRLSILYDLIPLRAPRHYLSGPGSIERYQARARWVGGSDHILAISAHTREEGISLLGCPPDRISDIGAGVSEFFTPADGTDEELLTSRVPDWRERPFIVAVAGSDARKNTDRLIWALPGIADVDLVIVGDLTAGWRERLSHLARVAGVGGRVHLLGEVTDDLLRACYRHARLTVMPSLAEGSGLPILESAACGTPAAGSRTTAVADTVGVASACFDPTDVGSIAGCVSRLLADPDLHAEVLQVQAQGARSAPWAAVADRVAGIAAGLSRPAPRPQPTPPVSIAMVGPVDPDGTGLERYQAAVAGALARTARVTTASPGYVTPTPVPGVDHVPAPLLGQTVRLASFDVTVYTIGNSAGHLDTVRAALAHPGWLWLHETRLPGLMATALDHLDDDGFRAVVDGLLVRSYPGRAPTDMAARAGRSNLDLIEAGVGLLHLLSSRCRGILVNSEAAARQVALDLPPGAAHPPIRVLPPGIVEVDPDPRPARTGRPVVATFGIVSLAKRPDLVLAACQELDCDVAFVGPCPPVLKEVIEDLARQLGMQQRVSVEGAVDAEAWTGWLRRAAVAVQLRQPSTGEMSAAILELLAHGVPVVTNLASAGEYPADCRRFLTTLSAADLAAELTGLLSMPGAGDALSAAGLAFAATCTFEGLARRLRSIVVPGT